MSRIVWFHPRQLVPPRGGGDFRTLGLLRGVLEAGHEVLLVVPGEGLAAPDDPVPGLRTVELTLRGGLSRAVTKVVSRSPLRAPRLTRSSIAAARRQVEDFGPDLGIASEGTIWGMVAALMPDVPWIYDSQNVEHELFAGHLAAATGVVDRLTFRVDHRRIAREERLLLTRSDATLVVSADDRAGLALLAPDADLVLVPSSMAAPARVASPADAGPTALLVGTLDFPPNIEAVELMVTEVMPRLRARCPDATLLVVGRRPTARVRELAASAEWAELWEDAPDIADAYDRARCVVMPFRSGSGTKLKLYEALGTGMPVVATPKGAAGVDVTPGSDILVAEDVPAFVDAVAGLIEDPRRAAELGAAARRSFEERLSWERASYPPLRELIERLTR